MNSKNRQNQRRWERYIELAADAGAIAMSLRDRPTRLDWMGVGLRVVGLVIRVRAERRRADAGDPWGYFAAEGLDRRWTEVPEEFRKLVMEHVGEVEVDEGFWSGEDDAARICHAQVGGQAVAWVADGKRVLDGPYVLRERATATFRALGERLWRRLGTNHCAYGSGGLVADRLSGDDIAPTAQLVDLEARMAAFLAGGVPRSYLLLGPPGTGKSAGIRWLAARLGLSTVRVDIAALGQHHYGASTQVVTSLQTLLELLRPELMILDDLDRVGMGADLLHFLEVAGRTCRVVMASANCADQMIGAALRPGRFDEVVRFDRLDPVVLRHLLGEDGDLEARMAALPAAYVAEFVKRRRILGRVAAEAALAELEQRHALIAQKTDDGE